MNMTQHEFLRQIEDTLGLHCFCEVQPKLSDYCPVHGSGDALLQALTEHQEHTTVEISRACEKAKEEADEEFADDREELEEARLRIDKLETTLTHMTCVVEDSNSLLRDAMELLGDPKQTNKAKLLMLDVIADMKKLQEDR